MYYIQKTFEVSACHHLTLSHGSKCENVHGHNWLITVYCKSETLDEDGMNGGLQYYQTAGAWPT